MLSWVEHEKSFITSGSRDHKFKSQLSLITHGDWWWNHFCSHFPTLTDLRRAAVICAQVWTMNHSVLSFRVLQFFNTSPDDYTVIFTSGCTGALKLVAECFDFYGYTCSSCHSNSVQNGEAAEVKGTSKIGSGLSEREEDKDNSCRRGSFIYLLDNHTSVQGMRELAFSRAGRVRCIDCDKDNVISKEHVLYQSEVYKNGGNSLFAYPAQSNFSGQKYPMEWISSVQNGRLGRMTLDGGRCCVLLDAACLVSTSPLDLGCYKPDFVTLSFYKIFGYPTGLGMLSSELRTV